MLLYPHVVFGELGNITHLQMANILDLKIGHNFMLLLAAFRFLCLVTTQDRH